MNNKFIIICLFLIFMVSALVAAPELGLIAHYTFDKKQDNKAIDVTGNGNDGVISGGSWVATKEGQGLKADIVDFGYTKNLKMNENMTYAIWLTLNTQQYPNFETNWIILTDELYNLSGFMLRINGDSGRLVYRSNQSGTNQAVFSEIPIRNNTLHYVVITKKGATVSIYIDGLPSGSGIVSEAVSDDMPLTIPNFPGVFSDIKVFNKTLDAKEIAETFIHDAPLMGKPFWNLNVYPQSSGGTVTANLTFNSLLKPSSSVFATVELNSLTDSKPYFMQGTLIKPDAYTFNVVFYDAIDLKPGEYEVKASLDNNRQSVPVIEKFKWSGATDFAIRARKAKALNNLVIELLNDNKIKNKTWKINVPFDSWIFVQSKGSGSFSLNFGSMTKDKPNIASRSGFKGTLEAMRYMKAGEYIINAQIGKGAQLKNIIVRCIPELIYCEYPNNPFVTAYGPYDWDFLKKYVLTNANCIVANPGLLNNEQYLSNIQEWKARGGRIIFTSLIPKENVIETWASHPGVRNPLADGIIIDEFPAPTPKEASWTDIIKCIYSDPRLKDKRFYAWSNGPFLYGSDSTREFTKLVMGLDGKFAMKFYLPNDKLTEKEARDFVYSELHPDAVMWEKTFPGSMRSLILNLGYMSHPQESCNMNPSTDFKVLMDIEMNILANDPSYKGLYGVAWYLAAYADEETVRWGAQLLRHYAIEGKKNMLSRELGYKYELDYIKNPDFANNTDGWKTEKAEPTSVEVKELNGWSWLEGRFPPTKVGDTFLWMKRSASKPNSFSQEIKNLVVGRLYSIKMITADYQDIFNGVSSKKDNAVQIKLENVNILPEHSIQEAITNNYSHFALGFRNTENKAWMNYHWRVFRAKGRTARLTVTDWASDKEPGGPINQELMYNFLQVQPYFAN